MENVNKLLDWMTLNIDYIYLIGVLFIFVGVVSMNDKLNKLSLERENRWNGYKSNISEATLQSRRQFGKLLIISGVLIIVVRALTTMFLKNDLSQNLLSFVIIIGVSAAVEAFFIIRLIRKPGNSAALEFQGVAQTPTGTRVPKSYLIVLRIFGIAMYLSPLVFFLFGYRSMYASLILHVILFGNGIVVLFFGIYYLYSTLHKEQLIRINAFWGVQTEITPTSLTVMRLVGISSLIMGVLIIVQALIKL